MKKLELNKMGLAPMSEFEMQEVDGGNFWRALLAIGVAVAAIGVTIGSAGLVTVGAVAIAAGLIGGDGV